MHLCNRLVHPGEYRNDVAAQRRRLLSTNAWQAPNGALSYALDGAIFVTGEGGKAWAEQPTRQTNGMISVEMPKTTNPRMKAATV